MEQRNVISYQIDQNVISVFRSIKFLYISIICTCLSIVMAYDNNTYTSSLFSTTQIYIWIELFGLILHVFKQCSRRVKKAIRLLSLLVKGAWINMTFFGLIDLFYEENRTFFYYFCGYLYITNVIYILILFTYLICFYKIFNNNNEERNSVRSAIVNDVSEIELFSKLTGLKNETMCSICFEDFQNNDTVRILPCNHYYHDNCISKWFETKTTCPICRYDLTEEPVYKN